VKGELSLWMNGEYVGAWRIAGTHVLEYAESWLKNPRARPLSLSLPLTADRRHGGQKVYNYFDNLLPDNDAIRNRIRTRFATASTDAFELLAAIGRDCVGAVQLLPPGDVPADIRKVEADPISDGEVAALLRSLRTTGNFGAPDFSDDFRISIAGAQEKTALLRHEGRWCRPHGSTPTTHIFKLPLGTVTRYNADFSDSIENEWLCARIARAFGLDVAETEMATFEGQSVLVVERFDREWHDGPEGPFLIRIPQEDLCQATGTPPSRKYERDGGPGMAKCLELMSTSLDPADAILTFVASQLLFWLLAAPDAHAKNYSLFIERGGAYSPTPLYDVLSAWPVIGKGANLMPYQDAGLAMAMRSRNAHYKFDGIQTRHWRDFAMRQGGEGLWEVLVGMVNSVDLVLEEVEAGLPATFPERVWKAVSEGMRRHARKFLKGPSCVDFNKR
jgi:serine/threonine-protein kinase HipA